MRLTPEALEALQEFVRRGQAAQAAVDEVLDWLPVGQPPAEEVPSEN